VKRRLPRSGVAGLAALALVVGVFVGLGPLSGSASSHREAPLVSTDPQVDGTDLYAFVSPDKPDTVTLISNWIPFEEPAGGPNFYSFATHTHYDINIDNNGDAKPDVIYRWTFYNHRRNPNTFLYNTGPVNSLGDTTLNFYQTYNLYRINAKNGRYTTVLQNAIVAPVDVGAASMPNYQSLRDASIQQFNTVGGTGLSYSGPADDPFFLDLRVFDLLYGCAPPYPCTQSGNTSAFSETGVDTLKGFNIHTTAIQVPLNDVALNNDASANPIIGVWTTAERASTRVLKKNGGQHQKGSFVQVSRLGLPLVNEVVVPVGKKDFYNASKPVNDLNNFGSYILNPELPQLIQALYGVQAPATPRNDLLPLVTGFQGLNKPPGNVVPSDELRLNMSVPPCTSGCSRMGVLAGDNAGFPNGRRLSDDVIDASVQVLEGALIQGHPAIVDQLGDGVDANDVAFGPTFPYLALPHAGSDPNPHA
jgi:Domain of unknown function (DUF4331)